jgi:hypothetical protein
MHIGVKTNEFIDIAIKSTTCGMISEDHHGAQAGKSTVVPLMKKIPVLALEDARHYISDQQ